MEQEQLDRIKLTREQAELRKKIEMAELKNQEESGLGINQAYKKKNYQCHVSRLCSRESPSPSPNGMPGTGLPTSRGSLLINEQHTSLSEERKHENQFSFPSGRPGIFHIISKLFPCFPCCQKRNAQIVQETNKCGNYAGNFGYDNKQVIENKLEKLGEISGSEHVKGKRIQRRLNIGGGAGINHSDTDEYMFNSQPDEKDDKP